MRPIDQLLGEYAESHRNPTNRLIHKVCVPLIVYSTVGLMWWVHPYLALAFMVFAVGYYLRLSWPFALAMGAAVALMCLSFTRIPAPLLLPVMGAIWVTSWIAQFIGHEIEGKKPSFFRDVFFLLIGPLWVLAPVFRKLKIAY
jgi:uncharacterized membrane protein YGL010W